VKALVIRQPWASLIAHGIKTIETRGFRPTNTIKPGEQFAVVAGKVKGNHRDPAWGPMFVPGVHGILAEQFRPLAIGSVCAVVTFDGALPVVGEDGDLGMDEPCLEYRPKGASSAGLWHWPNVDELGDDLNPPEFTDQIPLGDFTPGRYGWLLSNPVRLTNPVPCPAVRPDGTRTVMQGVFTLPDDVLAAVLPQLP
jgi:hypothetical protein